MTETVTRTATCRCADVSIECAGEPVRVSVCHCLECQKRTGSAFGAQARFEAANVRLMGETARYKRIVDSGKWARYQVCPRCGSTVLYENEGMRGLVAIPIGAFADPGFPPPGFSVYESRRHGWVSITGEVEHED